jgi:HK97 family phage major capsid protein
MTIENIIRDLETKVTRNKKYVEDTLASAKSQGRSHLTQTEDAECERRLDEMDADKAKLARARAVKVEEDAINADQQVTHPVASRSVSNRVASFSVTRSERTYDQSSDPDGKGFLADVIQSQVHRNPDATDKLSRHMREERIERAGHYEERAAGDLLSGGGGGIVVPQYLVDLTAPAVAARRPFADACTPHLLPDVGMSLTIPTITTATSAAIQATQLTSVSATSMNETDLTLAVKTAAGSQNVSRQAADRSRLDDFVVSDLMARYATALDNELVNGATTGLDTIATGVTPSSIDFSHVYTAVLGRQALVEATLLGGKADLVVMHSRRWAWLSSQLTSTWPAINQNGVPEHASGMSNVNAYGSATRGVLPNGMAVIVDNNVSCLKDTGSTCDRLYVVPSLECHLWEAQGSPVMIRAEQPNAANLGILLVVFGYFAYTFNRYGSGAMGSLQGLTAPTF